MAPLLPTACPHCAARDVVELENGELFCPWCLWSASPQLILEAGNGREKEYLDELAGAFERD